jgi:hypothetical protein
MDGPAEGLQAVALFGMLAAVKVLAVMVSRTREVLVELEPETVVVTLLIGTQPLWECH